MSKKWQKKAAERQELCRVALSLRCPTCKVKEGVWCYMTFRFGPDMHERRYKAAQEIQEANNDQRG